MATVKICTTGGMCITCGDTSVKKVIEALEKLEKGGKKYFCCTRGKTPPGGVAEPSCVRIDKITTIVVESTIPPDTCGDGGRFINVGNPKSVVINY